MEQRDYDPHPGVYIAERKKTTKEELKRKEIEVKFLKKLNESGRGR